MYIHFRSKHRDKLADDGSAEEFGVPRLHRRKKETPLWGVVPKEKLPAVKSKLKELGCRLERRDKSMHLTYTSSKVGDHVGSHQREDGDENKLLMPIMLVRRRTTRSLMQIFMSHTERKHVVVEILREFCCREPQHNFNAQEKAELPVPPLRCWSLLFKRESALRCWIKQKTREFIPRKVTFEQPHLLSVDVQPMSCSLCGT
jgi:hypothetical protein